MRADEMSPLERAHFVIGNRDQVGALALMKFVADNRSELRCEKRGNPLSAIVRAPSS